MSQNIAEKSARDEITIPFGIDRSNCAAALRELADQMEAGKALPQTVNHLVRASGEDFLMHVVTIKFAERRQA